MDWKSILGEGFGDKVLDVIKEMAHALGIAAEHVYMVLVRQQMIFGIASMLGCGIGFGFSLWILRWVWKNKDKLDELGFTLTFGTIGSVVGLVLCTIFFFQGFMHCLSPEYYAIREIMSAVSGNSK